MQKKNAGSSVVHLKKEVTSPEDMFAVRPYVQTDRKLHEHDCFELAYVTEGCCEHTVNNVTERLQKGDYFIIDFGSSHSYQSIENLKLINCLFLPEAIEETLSGSRSFEELFRLCLIRYHKKYLGKTPVNRIFHDEDGRVLALLLGMQEEYAKKQIGYEEIFRNRLMEILILTMRKVMQETSMSEPDLPFRSDLVAKLIQYLEAHYTEPYAIGKFCQEFHYSLQYVSRRFRSETGMTASEYIQRLRIERACGLLAGSDLQIHEIAHISGYEDLKFFHEVFRRMLKVSPREYRKVTRSAK